MKVLKLIYILFFALVFLGCSNDDKITPKISFGRVLGLSVAESSVATNEITIHSTIPVNETVIVSFEITGDAELDVDYELSDDVFIIIAGEAHGEIKINTINDSIDEPLEKFKITMTEVLSKNATISPTSFEYDVEIRDDD